VPGKIVKKVNLVSNSVYCSFKSCIYIFLMLVHKFVGNSEAFELVDSLWIGFIMDVEIFKVHLGL
jgi:hypothetical protein